MKSIITDVNKIVRNLNKQLDDFIFDKNNENALDPDNIYNCIDKVNETKLMIKAFRKDPSIEKLFEVENRIMKLTQEVVSADLSCRKKSQEEFYESIRKISNKRRTEEERKESAAILLGLEYEYWGFDDISVRLRKQLIDIKKRYLHCFKHEKVGDLYIKARDAILRYDEFREQAYLMKAERNIIKLYIEARKYSPYTGIDNKGKLYFSREDRIEAGYNEESILKSALSLLEVNTLEEAKTVLGIIDDKA